ncbi:MAG: hypothetical protein IJZ19_12475 [Lentisphaeria bacterium]|nr:hypothetical protein [Lentisphaeria bacterium]MBQ9776900.1 hypothetical protein [Lentisphaeria bacterium]
MAFYQLKMFDFNTLKFMNKALFNIFSFPVMFGVSGPSNERVRYLQWLFY